jgi:hypothetical protein
MSDDKKFSLHYKGNLIKSKIPITNDIISTMLSEQTFDKIIDDNDIKRLSQFLPNNIPTTKEEIKNILFSKSNILSPIDTFKLMFNNNYFNEDHQKNLNQNEIESIEDYISKFKNVYKYLELNSDKIINQFSEKEDKCKEVLGEDGYESALNNGKYYDNDKFETNSYLASSGYSSLYSEEDKEIEQYDTNKDRDQGGADSKEDENPLEVILSNDRFKNLKTNKNQLTIKPRTKEELIDFQRQEFERYKNPHLPWKFVNADGITSIVAPVLKKIPTNNSSKPRDHIMLKPDRPSYVTILSLVRDAASRLMDGVGTRADICDLLKDSQYINESLSDSQINNIVSGALDRLHYEKDPCVKYDLQRKLWIYLHKIRQLDYPAWNEHLKTNDKVDKSANKTDKANSVLELNEEQQDQPMPIDSAEFGKIFILLHSISCKRGPIRQ